VPNDVVTIELCEPLSRELLPIEAKEGELLILEEDDTLTLLIIKTVVVFPGSSDVQHRAPSDDHLIS